MGVYLSTPVTELVAEDGQSSNLVYGSASMQGWRVSQEDAHIAIVDFDTDSSLFGVFDGHGGQEVAIYCAQHLPNFLKSLKSYQNNQIDESLEEAFLKFDQSLTKHEVIQELKILAETEDLDKEVDEEDINEAILLREEADIPIEDLMARYSKGTTDDKEDECSSSSHVKRLPLPSHLIQDKQKPLSPYLRAKRSVSNEVNHRLRVQTDPSDQCSSSSASTSVAPKELNSEDVSNSESNSTSQPDSTNKIDLEINESNELNETNESKSNGELISSNDKSIISSTGTDCQPSSSITDGLPNDDNQITTSDNKDIDNNSNNKSEVETNEANSDKSSEQTSTPVSSKGKGKQKKITPKIVSTTTSADISDETANPIYKAFLEDFDETDDDSNDDFDANLDDDDEDDDEEDDDEEDEESSDDDLDDEDSELIVQSSGGYEEPGRDSGCTAVVALMRGNQLYVANAGDSRCVVSRNGKAVEMSFDHKPEDDIERIRVEKAGGKVTPDGRVNGGLNLSRAIGDHSYKNNPNVSDREQMITALPDIKSLTLEFPSDQFMVIACDGIWNSLNSQQVIDFVGERIEKTSKLSSICDELFKSCLAPNTMGDGTGCDNMTCIIVKFTGNTSKRKLDDINEESEQLNNTNEEKLELSAEPETKRIKTDDCITDSIVNETEVKV